MISQPVAQAQGVHSRASGVAHGFAVFAGAIMILVGTFQAVAGLVGLLADDFYVVSRAYVFQLDVTAWGWIHLLVGAMVVFAGLGVLLGQTWARVIGIVLSVVSALTNFTFIPYYPLWSLLIIALHVVVIWALAVDRQEP